jgi:glutamine cyclotransferase
MEKLTPFHSIPSPSNHLCGLAWEKNNLWYSDGKESKIYKLEPETGKTKKIFQIPKVNSSLSWNNGYLWQVTGEDHLTNPKNVSKVNPSNGKVEETIPLGVDSEQIAGIDVKDEYVWVSLEKKARLQQRQLYTGKIIRDFEVEPRIAGIVSTDSLLYYCEFNQQLLVEMDPDTGEESAQYRVEGNPTDLTWDGEYFWYNDYTGKKIRKIKPI